MSELRIAVLGTGANGGSIGADLTRAGYNVTLIDPWPEHVQKMREVGITVTMPDAVETTHVRALHLSDLASIRERFDLVFLLVKAYDTRWAAELIRPYLADHAFVVGLQNGMTTVALAEILGARRILGAVIEMASSMFAPATVHRQTTRARSWFAVGGLVPESTSRAPEVAEVLSSCGRVEVVEDILSAKWMKLVVNAAELVPSAIANLPMLEAAQVPGVSALMTTAGREAMRVGLADGRRLVPILGVGEIPADPDAYVERLIGSVYHDFALPSTLTTVHQDWLKGRRSEAEDINGLVVTRGRALRVETPSNEAILDVALTIEAGGMMAGVDALQELLDRAGCWTQMQPRRGGT